MKKLTFIPILLLCSMQALNVKAESPDKEFNIYYNYYESKLFIDLENMYRIGDISLSYEMKGKNNWSHEFELMPFLLTKSKYTELHPANGNGEIVTGDRQSIYNSRLAYHLNYSIIRKKSLEFFTGLSTQLYFERQVVKPQTTFSFPKSYTNTGLILGFSPGIKIPLSEKMYLSGVIPVGLFRMGYSGSKMDNPALPSSERTNSDISAEIGYQGFQAKIGIGYRF